MQKVVEQKAKEWQLAMQNKAVEEKEQEILALRQRNEANEAKLREMTRFTEVREHAQVGMKNIQRSFTGDLNIVSGDRSDGEESGNNGASPGK